MINKTIKINLAYNEEENIDFNTLINTLKSTLTECTSTYNLAFEIIEDNLNITIPGTPFPSYPSPNYPINPYTPNEPWYQPNKFWWENQPTCSINLTKQQLQKLEDNVIKNINKKENK